jgi:uncharacterized protein RhaS with RHS repeats
MYLYIIMGCLKIHTLEIERTPLKVVYGKGQGCKKVMQRFIGVDPLADLAPDWTPYRYGFNNPILYTDPDGMFEDKAAAKQYAKDHGIKTGWFRDNKIVKQSDGTYAIENKKEHSSTFQDKTLANEANPDGVYTGAMVAANDVMKSEEVKEKDKLFGISLPFDVTKGWNTTYRDGTTEFLPLQTGTAPGLGTSGAFNAMRSLKGLEIGKAISLKNAIERLKSGKDVFSSTRELAKKLMKKASGGGKVIKDKAHGGKGSGYRDHFHDADRALDSHSFFGPPK